MASVGKSKESPNSVVKDRIRHLIYIEEIQAFFSKVFFLFVLIYIIFGFCFGLQPMGSNDMSPRLGAGDVALFYRLETKYSFHDVIVLKKDKKNYILRVIGLPGDKIDIVNDALIVNDSHLVESDIFYPTSKFDDNVSYPLELSEGEYFVLGDYRNGAKDSRFFGVVKAKEIKGKVITIFRRSNI